MSSKEEEGQERKNEGEKRKGKKEKVDVYLSH
jgi:hypothetical protein